eukprot:scaffold267015_cov15-Tisochrysis_lutea.AAC.1
MAGGRVISTFVVQIGHTQKVLKCLVGGMCLEPAPNQHPVDCFNGKERVLCICHCLEPLLGVGICTQHA